MSFRIVGVRPYKEIDIYFFEIIYYCKQNSC